MRAILRRTFPREDRLTKNNITPVRWPFKSEKPRAEPLHRLAIESDPIWDAVLHRALDAPSVPGETVLFLEDREDVIVDLDSQREAPRIDHSRTFGMAAQAPDRGLWFLADPDPTTVDRHVRWPDGAGGVPAEGPPPPGRVPDAWISVPNAVRALERALNATFLLHSSLRVRARWVASEQRIRVARRAPGVVGDRRCARRIRLEAELTRGGRRARGVAEAVLRSDTVESPVLEDLAARIVTRSEARLRATDLPSGDRPVVFAPGVGGVLIHEIVGHALEADAVLGGASWLAGSGAGPLRAADEILVLDDPRRCRAAWRIDDEGESARPTPLLRAGAVAGWLVDAATAGRSERAPTGHGRRGSFRESVRPRMGCTFLAAGTRDPGEALEGVEEGIYVRRMEAASTDTRTGRAVFRVTDADRILHGRLVSPLVPHLLSVDGHDALSSMDCIARDLAFDTCVGSCLHHGQPIPVSVGGPTFRIGLTRALF